jgi:hypothetical protein
MEKTEKILCILLNREGDPMSLRAGIWANTRFIAILDINSTSIELRENDGGPFGLPLLDTIVRGDLFWIETVMRPGSICTKIIEADLSDYSMLLGHKKILDRFEWSDSARGIEPDIRNRYSYHNIQLRDEKITKILG